MAGAGWQRAFTPIGLTAGLLALAGCGDPPEKNAEKPSVETFTVVETVAEPAFDGAIEAGAPVELSFAIAGTVEQVLVAVDDEIESGETLARLDPSPVERAVEAAEAALQHALAEQAAKASDLERKIQLVDNGLAGQDIVDEARAAHDAATDAVGEARAGVADARADLGKVAILSPFDGIVTAREIDPFEDVSAGQTLFLVVERAALYAAFTIPGGGIEIAAGQPVSVGIAALDTTLEGVVSRVAESLADDGSRSVSVDLVDPPASLRSGIAVLISLVDPPAVPSGFLIPVSALISTDGEVENGVFVYVPGEAVVRRIEVVVGETKGDRVRITDGLSPGDIVVVSGVSALSDGQPVAAPSQ